MIRYFWTSPLFPTNFHFYISHLLKIERGKWLCPICFLLWSLFPSDEFGYSIHYTCFFSYVSLPYFITKNTEAGGPNPHLAPGRFHRGSSTANLVLVLGTDLVGSRRCITVLEVTWFFRLEDKKRNLKKNGGGGRIWWIWWLFSWYLQVVGKFCCVIQWLV